jgi:hypothetical protein
MALTGSVLVTPAVIRRLRDLQRLADADVDLARPVPQRLREDAELASQPRDRLAAAPEQDDRLTAELQWIRHGIEHHLLEEPVNGPIAQVSTEAEELETGSETILGVRSS